MKEYLRNSVGNIKKIMKIRGEASQRSFFRFIDNNDNPKIAMVYPEKNIEEIEKIIKFTDILKKYKICVPEIFEIINDRIIILQDLGELSFQTAFRKANINSQKKLINKIIDIIMKLGNIPQSKTKSTLDKDRMKREMNFFLKYYIDKFYSENEMERLKNKLYASIPDFDTFGIVIKFGLSYIGFFSIKSRKTGV
jgi:aminoglycoside/choline kinase family phosphotransferase